MASAGRAWRNDILRQLEFRKAAETDPYSDLVNSHGKLLSIASISQLKIAELEHQTFKLKQEILELQGKIAIGGSLGPSSTNEKTLEHKIFKLQEELTEVHRANGENAQIIIKLTSELKEKDDKIAQKESKILDKQNDMDALAAELKRLETSYRNLEVTNQAIKDEHQALQMLYSAVDVKLKDTQEDNRQLVERWMAEKAKIADEVNAANAHDKRLREQRMQRDILEATKEYVNVDNKHYAATRTGSSFAPPSAYVVVTHVPDRPVQMMECHDGEVTSIKFSISGRYFVSGGADRKVKIWELQRGNCHEIATLAGCTASVMCTRFDMSEKLILASSNDNACRIWSFHDQKLKHTLTGHYGKVLSAKFLESDNSKIVSGSYDRTLKIWDLRSKVCTKTIFAGSSCNDLVTADTSGSTIISGHFDKKIRFWDVRREQDTNEIQLQGKVTSLDLSQGMVTYELNDSWQNLVKVEVLADMNYLLASTRDDSLKMIDLRRNQIVSTYRADGFRISLDYTRACFSPDAQFVLCGSYGGGLYVWNTKTHGLEKLMKEHKGSVVATAWHPNGTCLLSCDKNKQVILWTDV